MDNRTNPSGMSTARPGEVSSNQIKSEIEDTRSQMDRTLDELGERLRPRHLLDDLLDFWQSRRSRARSGTRDNGRRARQAASRVGRGVGHYIQEHPVPVALMGLGLAWLIYESERDESDEVYEFDEGDVDYDLVEEEVVEGAYAEPIGEGMYAEGSAALGPEPTQFALPSHYSESGAEKAGIGEKAGHKAHEMKEKASAVGHSMKERWRRGTGKAGQAARAARARGQGGRQRLQRRAADAGSRFAGQMRSAGQQSWDTFRTTAEEHPLAVGAGFLALGLLAGIALPSTRQENRIIGPRRDELIDRTRAAGREAFERGREVARTATHAAREEAEAQGLTPDTLKAKLGHVAESAQSAASQTAKSEGLNPAGLKEKAGAVVEHTKEEAKAESRRQTDEARGGSKQPTPGRQTAGP